MANQNKVLPFDAATDIRNQRQQRLIWMGTILRDAMELGRLRHYWVMDVEMGAAYVTGRAGSDGTPVELRVKWTGDGWHVEKKQLDAAWEPAKLGALDLSINALVGIAELIELDLR